MVGKSQCLCTSTSPGIGCKYHLAPCTPWMRRRTDWALSRMTIAGTLISWRSYSRCRRPTVMCSSQQCVSQTPHFNIQHAHKNLPISNIFPSHRAHKRPNLTTPHNPPKQLGYPHRMIQSTNPIHPIPNLKPQANSQYPINPHLLPTAR